MTKLTSGLFAFSVGIIALKQVQAGVTIFQPVPTDPALQSNVDQADVIGVSAVAVASGGATQYVATEVATALAVDGTTVTFNPTTFLVSFEQGASTYHVSQATTATVEGVAVVIDVELNCGPGTGDNLNCVEEDHLSAAGTQTSSTLTFAATESALFTITGSTGPLPTAKSSTIRAGPFMATTFLFVGFFYALVCIF